MEGVHKEAFIEWLEANAILDELENPFYMLCDIRTRFALRIPLSQTDLEILKKRLEDNVDMHKHIVSRPGHRLDIGWSVR